MLSTHSRRHATVRAVTARHCCDHRVCRALVAPGRAGALLAQSAVAGKKPLSYDVYDAWWSIQGTTLSRDGEWLAYALTSQGLDGQLVVRNLRTGQEFEAPARHEPRVHA